MAAEVLSVLHLDREPLRQNSIVIGECQDTDTAFFHCSLIIKQLKDGGAVCFVNFHNDSEFYNKVCRKMGFNMTDPLATGSIKFIDCISYINQSLCGDDEVDIDFLNKSDSLDTLFAMIKQIVLQSVEKYDSVLILIDDLTHLLDLNYDLSEINLLYQRCKKVVHDYPQCSLEVGVHIVSENHESNILYNVISHMSSIGCKTTSLKTGRSLEVTGSLSIVNSVKSQSANFYKNVQNYHYKLFDRGIKVFAPGTK